MLLHLVWLAMTILRFAGVFVVFAGVMLFGAYFIAGNARSARDGGSSVPASSWLGPGPRKAMKIIALGAAMLLGAFLTGLLLPHGA